MKMRRLVTYLLVGLMPLALAFLTLDAARASVAPTSAVMPAHMAAGCHESGPSAPARAPSCGPDCPLSCAPVIDLGSAVDVPVRPYAQLRYDLTSPGLRGRALEPELPPPRR